MCNIAVEAEQILALCSADEAVSLAMNVQGTLPRARFGPYFNAYIVFRKSCLWRHQACLSYSCSQRPTRQASSPR